MSAEELSPLRPVAPIDYTPQLSCPILGLFGEEDHNPTPEQVTKLEEVLRAHGKAYEFHMYPEAGHGFFYYDRSAYRPRQAVDGWEKIFTFLETHLGGG
jgi:carboxymethylenebutenolidase